MKKSISEKYLWNTSDIYKDFNEWENDFEKLKKYLPVLVSYRGKLNDINNIYKYLQLSKEVDLLEEKLAVYLHLLRSCDLKNAKYIEYQSILSAFIGKLVEETSFDIVEFGKLDDAVIKKILGDKRFENNKMFFNNIIRNRPHILTEPEERILSASARFNNSSEVYDMLCDVDIKFDDVLDSKGKKHHLNHSTFSKYLRSTDALLRKNAFLSMYKTYGQFSNTIATNYINHLNADWFYSKTSKFESTLSSALFGNKIDNVVYTNLLDNVHKMLPTLYKFFGICKKTTKLKEYHIYDTYLPIVKGVDKSITYDECIDTALDALKILGKEYIDVVKYAIKNRWIDVYPKDAKTSGAFQIDCYGVHPYIMLNFNEKAEYVSTFVHEMGHAMHSYFSNKTQSYENASYPIFLAEVASTVNEIILIKYNIEHAKTKKERAYYLSQYILMFKSTIFRQTMFSEFEQYAHNLVEGDKPISKDILSKYYYDLNKLYFGSNVKIDKDIEYEWMRIPHFYTSYYVYKYATGLISAINLVENIYNTNDGLDKYLHMLSMGGSDYPVETLKKAGVDLTSNEPYNVANNILLSLIKQLEENLK